MGAMHWGAHMYVPVHDREHLQGPARTPNPNRVATSNSPLTITVSMLHSLPSSHSPDAAPLPPPSTTPPYAQQPLTQVHPKAILSQGYPIPRLSYPKAILSQGYPIPRLPYPPTLSLSYSLKIAFTPPYTLIAQPRPAHYNCLSLRFHLSPSLNAPLILTLHSSREAANQQNDGYKYIYNTNKA